MILPLNACPYQQHRLGGVERRRHSHYATYTDHMTSVIELLDPITGQLLGRVVDTLHGSREGRFAPGNPVTNLANAQMPINHWAGTTLTALDYAKPSLTPGSRCC